MENQINQGRSKSKMEFNYKVVGFSITAIILILILLA